MLVNRRNYQRANFFLSINPGYSTLGFAEVIPRQLAPSVGRTRAGSRFWRLQSSSTKSSSTKAAFREHARTIQSALGPAASSGRHMHNSHDPNLVVACPTARMHQEIKKKKKIQPRTWLHAYACSMHGSIGSFLFQSLNCYFNLFILHILY